MPHKLFSVRRGVREPFELQGGVPLHIKGALVEWVESFVASAYNGINTRLLDLLIATLQLPIIQLDEYRRYDEFLRMMQLDDDLFLDIVDILCGLVDHEDLDNLDSILSVGLSQYMVRREGTPGLDDRVTQETRQALTEAVAPNDAASGHLAQAWTHAYGRDRNPGQAWALAVKAVEALLHPIVEPANTKATLGTMTAAIRAKPEKWEFVLTPKDGTASAGVFLRCLEVIGYEPGRHGTDSSTATLEQARAVVLQAITVVEWLRTGALKRVKE